METWDIPTAEAILHDLRHMDMYKRIYGHGWSRFLDDLAEKYGAEPDMRPRLNIGFTERS